MNIEITANDRLSWKDRPAPDYTLHKLNQMENSQKDKLLGYMSI